MSNPVNFHNKTFVLNHNSANGTSNSNTIFHYQQNENVVTATFSGGAVVHGTIIALHRGDYLNMIYQMLTVEQVLKSGKAIAKIKVLENGKIQLNLDWEWLSGSGEIGVSEYCEVS